MEGIDRFGIESKCGGWQGGEGIGDRFNCTLPLVILRYSEGSGTERRIAQILREYAQDDSPFDSWVSEGVS